MEYIPEDDILAMGISIFKILGEFTSYKWRTPIRIYRFFNCSVCILNITLLLANLSQAQGYMYIRIFESIGTVAHGLIKYVCLFYYASDILDLIRQTQKFYDFTEFRETFLYAKTLLLICKSFQKLFVTLCVVSLNLYFLKPVTTGVGFIFPSRIIIDSIMFETVILSSQYYYIFMVGVIISGYDLLYISYAIHLLIQLRILKYKFEHTTRNSSITEIHEYIKYHQLLLSIFDKMRRIYNWMFFFFYIITLSSACVQLYMLLLGVDKISDLIMAFIYIAVLLTQLSFYTIPVEEIVLQFSEISSAIYKSSWYDRNLQDRKLLLFVMMKAQRQNYLSAGGIIEMNTDTFTSVIRKVFSFYTILRNVLNK